MSDEFNSKEIEAELIALRDSLKTVHIATQNPDGMPQASYAPYLWFEQSCYLYLSELAKHTINLSLNPNISLLFIESEAGSRNLFARRRILLQGEVLRIDRESQLFEKIMSRFKQRFGDFIDVIEPLQDFHLFQVNPASGRFIRGFAQAFELCGEDLSKIRPVKPDAELKFIRTK
ncbi:MAG: HugZ family protein [Gammaproteobacteria bacterium]